LYKIGKKVIDTIKGVDWLWGDESLRWFPLDRDKKGSRWIVDGGNFITVFDATDHFDFLCVKCGKLATIMELRYETWKGEPPTIVVELLCDSCKTMGKRKWYINNGNAKYDLRNEMTYYYPKGVADEKGELRNFNKMFHVESVEILKPYYAREVKVEIK
jgi:hypothetical protein